MYFSGNRKICSVLAQGGGTAPVRLFVFTLSTLIWFLLIAGVAQWSHTKKPRQITPTGLCVATGNSLHGLWPQRIQ